MRLRSHDYTASGAYFVTVCTSGRRCLFGHVSHGEMVLSELGRSVEQIWRGIPIHFAHVALDEFVVMPNHLHGLVVFTDPVDRRAKPVGARHAAPVPFPFPDAAERRAKPVGAQHAAPLLGTIVRSFKAEVTKRANAIGTRRTLWQRNYYDHIVRDEPDLCRIREYIVTNPARWAAPRPS